MLHVRFKVMCWTNPGLLLTFDDFRGVSPPIEPCTRLLESFRNLTHLGLRFDWFSEALRPYTETLLSLTAYGAYDSIHVDTFVDFIRQKPSRLTSLNLEDCANYGDLFRDIIVPALPPVQYLGIDSSFTPSLPEYLERCGRICKQITTEIGDGDKI